MEDDNGKGELQDSPAIKALGSLFKLTQVNFWVDISTGIPYGSTSLECSKTVKDDVICLSNTDADSFSVDTELSRQMDELGLPLSFCTNKEKRNGKVRGKRMDTHKKVLHAHEETTDEVLDSIKLKERELVSPAVINDKLSSSSDSMSTDVHVDENGKNEKNGWLEERLGDPLVESQISEVKQPQESGGALDSHFPNDCDKVCSGSNDEFGDWMIYWDEFYGRNYYYNSRTQESTWESPPGMEHLDFVYVENESQEIVVEKNDSQEPNSGVLQDGVSLSDEFRSDVTSRQFHDEHNQNEPLDVNKSTEGSSLFDLPDTLCPLSSKEYGGNICAPEKLDLELDVVPNKRKKKVKRTWPHRRLLADNKAVQFEELMEEFSPIISKYWCQRYLLFSKYDDDIKMDEEGWFSVTPEPIAKHHAVRCGSGIIVDFFTGVGGNAIQFAPKSTHVIAIDIDPKKIEYAHHNAAIYGVKDVIEFISGDSFILAHKLKADTVFLSPPWGGPEYAKARNFDMNTMLKPHDGQFLFNVAQGIAPRIVMFLPRNVDINQLAELSLSVNPPWTLEVEKNFINGKLKAITAYFTDPLPCKTVSD